MSNSARKLMAVFGSSVVLLFLSAAPVLAETYYFHTDHLGTPQSVTDSTQQIAWQAEYDPFGEATETVTNVEQNLRFPGQYRDRENGIHYNYFRTYDPTIGRYTQSDPIGLDGGLNTYGYTGSNPISMYDLFGLEKFSLFDQSPIWTSGSINLHQSKVFPDKSGTLMVFGHGTPAYMIDGRGFGSKKISPSDLASMIRESGLWNDSMPIEIWGCATGDGENSFAQKLADLLRSDVSGFTENIYSLNLKPETAQKFKLFKPRTQ